VRKAPYDLGYQHLLSCNMGEFVPVGIKEILPNDSIKHSVTALIRTMALNKPLMHRVNASLVHYFIPKRILWDDFEDFITGGPNGISEPTYPTIAVPSGGFAVGSLADYLGLAPDDTNVTHVSALPFRAVAACYNEWIRDQDLIAPVNISTASGVDNITNTDLLAAMWEKDWLTTARPWPQKGPEVMLPIIGNAPVVTNNQQITMNMGSGVNRPITGATSTGGGWLRNATGENGPVSFGNQSGLIADMTQVAGISVVDNRVANFIQRFQEKMSKQGSEFKDYLRGLGVKFSDARLQIPERLGSTTTVMQFSEVLATAESENIEIGDMKGHGITGVQTKGYDRWFEENGFLISFLVVRPKTVYMDLVDPMWFYDNKYDYWQQGLEHVGQVEILNKMVKFGHDEPDGVFGYQDRYDHLRYSENRVSGEFRTTESDWHMARALPNDVALNGDFVACNPTDRIWPVDRKLADHLYVNILHNLRARRLVSPNTNSFLK